MSFSTGDLIAFEDFDMYLLRSSMRNENISCSYDPHGLRFGGVNMRKLNPRDKGDGRSKEYMEIHVQMRDLLQSPTAS